MVGIPSGSSETTAHHHGRHRLMKLWVTPRTVKQIPTPPHTPARTLSRVAAAVVCEPLPLPPTHTRRNPPPGGAAGLGRAALRPGRPPKTTPCGRRRLLAPRTRTGAREARRGRSSPRTTAQELGEGALRQRRLGLLRRRDLHPLDLHLLVPVLPGPGRDEVPNDDVLLEPQQIVASPADRRVGEHPRRLLERRRRDERLRRQTRLRDPEQQRLGDRLPLP